MKLNMRYPRGGGMMEQDEVNEMFMMSNGVPIHPEKRIKNRFMIMVKKGTYDVDTLTEVKGVIDKQLEKICLDDIRERGFLD
jgi:hypothetical protein